jgi:hypothetical protein
VLLILFVEGVMGLEVVRVEVMGVVEVIEVIVLLVRVGVGVGVGVGVRVGVGVGVGVGVLFLFLLGVFLPDVVEVWCLIMYLVKWEALQK